MMTSRERLEFLANALERNAENPEGMKFLLTCWLVSPTTNPSIDCGTVGCAIGLAMLLPEFQVEGLEMGSHGLYGRWVPVYGSFARFAAVSEFFGIAYGTAEYLFNSNSYDPEQQRGAKAELAVANRIRQFLANPRQNAKYRYGD